MTFGEAGSRRLYTALLVLPFGLLPLMAWRGGTPGLLLPLLLAPSAWRLRRAFVECPRGRRLQRRAVRHLPDGALVCGTAFGWGAAGAGVASGEVDFTAIGLNTVAPLVAAGRLRPLAVAAAQRLAALPAVPTLVEAGGPPEEMHLWAALVARAVRGRAEQAGFEITPSSPRAVRERIEADLAGVAPLVREGRIACA